MDNNFNINTDVKTKEENVLAGTVGAFLFSLAGGALWFGMYMLGFLAGISGLIGVVCAIKGYSVFAKKESTKGIIISTLMAFAVLVVAWYFCCAYDIYTVHIEWYEMGEIDFKVTFAEAVSAVPFYLTDKEVGPAYIGDLAIGLLLGLVGAGSYVVSKFKNNKNKNHPAPTVAAESAQPTEEPASAEPTPAAPEAVTAEAAENTVATVNTETTVETETATDSTNATV